MIISASRRTDIPNYYSGWFYHRIKEGFLYVRNPMNFHQISRINLSPEVVDCIVFWTKNPEPMMERLEELKDYRYYFQFTLTGYGRDIEPNVPHKKEKMIPTFKQLSDKLGDKRVIWRYDPIIFTNTYTREYHVKAFKQIAEALNGYTRKCVISFVDAYAKNRRNMNALHAYELKEEELKSFAKQLSEIAHDNGMEIAACAEYMNLSDCGIVRNCCIDKNLIEEIIGYKIKAGKDKNQREECGCIESVEIGSYDTCRNGCKYCYANCGQEFVHRNCLQYDANSPLLCGGVLEGDRVTERKVRSLREGQLTL